MLCSEAACPESLPVRKEALSNLQLARGWQFYFAYTPEVSKLALVW